jgi:hypothetical protein
LYSNNVFINAVTFFNIYAYFFVLAERDKVKVLDLYDGVVYIGHIHSLFIIHEVKLKLYYCTVTHIHR